MGNVDLAKKKRESIKSQLSNYIWEDNVSQNGFKYYFTMPQQIDKIELGINKIDAKKFGVYLLFQKMY